MTKSLKNCQCTGILKHKNVSNPSKPNFSLLNISRFHALPFLTLMDWNVTVCQEPTVWKPLTNCCVTLGNWKEAQHSWMLHNARSSNRVLTKKPVTKPQKTFWYISIFIFSNLYMFVTLFYEITQVVFSDIYHKDSEAVPNISEDSILHVELCWLTTTTVKPKLNEWGITTGFKPVTCRIRLSAKSASPLGLGIADWSSSVFWINKPYQLV